MNRLFTILILIPLWGYGQSNIGRGQAKRLYDQHCAVCHGVRGQGGLGGTLVSGEWQHGDTPEDHARVIREGLPRLNMQGFGDKLNEKEIRSLVIYMRELKQLADANPRPPERDGKIVTQKITFRIEEVAKNDQRMWGVTFLPDGQFLVSETRGELRLINPDGTLLPPVKDAPPAIQFGQGGMMDVATGPDFKTTGWIYVAFTHGEGRSTMTSLVRGRIKENTWVDNEVLFRAEKEDRRGSGVHFGSRIVFRDGHVFFSIGDRGAKQQAQSLETPNGKIHRLTLNGDIPPDNPFVGEAGYESIWSYGHRNPQALVVHPDSGLIWSTEHGPRGGDELNVIRKGLNYGWPKVTFGMNYSGTPITEHTSLPGMEPPVWHWTPSIAVCGMAVAHGDVYPEWEGDLLVGGLRSNVLERLTVTPDSVTEREVVLKDQGRVRDVKTGPDGFMYLILEGNGSRLVRLVPERD